MSLGRGGTKCLRCAGLFSSSNVLFFGMVSVVLARIKWFITGCTSWKKSIEVSDGESLLERSVCATVPE